jgi:membrane associated rhomboid family serine protease
MLLGLFAWLVPVVGPTLGAAVVAGVLGGDRPPRGLDYAGGYAVGTVVVLVATGVGVAVGPVSLPAALIATVTLVTTGSLAVVYRIDAPRGEWGRTLRSRLLLGVPWGTLVAVGGVLSVYLFVQGGITSWYDPVTLPFRSWSLLYPLGLVTAPFAHNSAGHIVGNLVGTVVLGSLAEYAWGHFPRERGTSAFGSLGSNPYVRALLVFPAVVVVVGLLTSLFALGPVIGFSGVVFAFAGFAVTRYPLGTVVGLAGSSALQLAYNALQQPVLTAQASPSPPSAPWWAQVAIQAHALGLLLGVVLGWFVFARRKRRPSALRLWTGVLLLAVERSLWAVYWFRGSETFVLFRGPGIVLVVALALLVAAALTASDRPLLDRLGRDQTSGPAPTPAVEADGGRDHDRDATDDSGATDPPRPVPGATADDQAEEGSWLTEGELRLTGRTVAVAFLLVGLGLLAGPGVGSKVFTVADAAAPGNESGQVTVRDYTVGYAEDVTNERVAIVDVELFNETTAVETSGVIVTSPRRGIWQQVVSTGRLAFDGTVTVDLGGVGWRESVTAVRRGWSADGGGTAYKVWLEPEAGDRRLSFRSETATAADTVAGRNVTVSPGVDGFFLIVERDGEPLSTAPMPAANESVTAGGLTLTNEAGTVYAAVNDTRVKMFSEETYE